MKKQVYKLELSKNEKIYDVFHISLLEHDITRKRRVNKNIRKFNFGNNNKYKIERI